MLELYVLAHDQLIYIGLRTLVVFFFLLAMATKIFTAWSVVKCKSAFYLSMGANSLGAANENIVQNHLNIALFNVF